MAANIHAENMRLYALDAAETEHPYVRWEICTNPELDEWDDMWKHPTWENHIKYRRKLKPFTVRINGGSEFSFATALRRVPAADATVYTVFFSPQEAAFVAKSEKWDTNLTPHLKGGLCFDTPEGAEDMRDILNMIVSAA